MDENTCFYTTLVFVSSFFYAFYRLAPLLPLPLSLYSSSSLSPSLSSIYLSICIYLTSNTCYYTIFGFFFFSSFLSEGE